MKKYAGIFLALIVFMSVACKSDSDVLATYEGGQITRGEFNEWLEGRRVKLENILKKKSMQESKLRQMAIDVLTAKEAEKAGYEKDPDYMFAMSIITPSWYTNYLRKKLTEKSSFEDELVKVRLIKLLIKDYKIEKNRRVKLSDAEVEKVVQEKREKALSVIKELEGGKSFEELAKKYSDDFSKKKGGDIGFISRGMRGEEFSNAAFALKEGEYTKEPVKIRKAFYIIKVEDREKVTEDNIESVVDDENQAKRLKRKLSVNYMKNMEKKLTDAEDVKNNFSDLETLPTSANTVLFKVGEEEFKVADINKVFDVFYKKGRVGSSKKMNFDDKVKKNMLERIFKERLWKREAIKQGLEKDEEFKKYIKANSLMTLSVSYRNNIVLKDISVTNKEMMDEYNKNKQRAYTKKKRQGNKTVSTVLPFSEVKERIEYQLFNQKRSKKRRDWDNNLIKKYKFAVNKKELQGE